MRFVAVVMKYTEADFPGNDGVMERPAVLTSLNKKRLISKAIEKRDAMLAGRQDHERTGQYGPGPYKILIGQLTEEVITPVSYELRPLD